MYPTNQPTGIYPTEYSTVAVSEENGALFPTVSFNLNSAFSGAPEQLAEAQSQIEQDQLNRAGAFALEFQRLAQAKGLAVNMQFNIHNDYDLTGGSGVIPVLPEDYTEDE